MCVLERAEFLSQLNGLAFAVPQLSKEYDLEVFSEELDGSEEDTVYFPAKQSIVIRQKDRQCEICWHCRVRTVRPFLMTQHTGFYFWITAMLVTTEVSVLGDTSTIWQPELSIVPQSSKITIAHTSGGT